MISAVKSNRRFRSSAEEACTASACYQDYQYRDAAPFCTSAYLLPALSALCDDLPSGTRVLDVGCGNGFLAGHFLSNGWKVVGIDLSATGIEIARSSYPTARFEVLAADENMLTNLGEQPFDILVSSEVIEHLYAPRQFVQGVLPFVRSRLYGCPIPRRRSSPVSLEVHRRRCRDAAVLFAGP